MSRKYMYLSPAMAVMLMSVHMAAQAEPGAVATPAEPAPTPTSFPAIDVIRVDYGGSGCPQGSAAVAVAVNRSELLMLFDEHVARTAPGEQTDYKSCNVAMHLRIPAGYQIALRGFEYGGYADISAGGQGLLHAEYFVTGSAGSYSYTTSFPPGTVGKWVKVDRVDDRWSPCGGDVLGFATIDAVVGKSSPWSSAESELVLDSVGYWFDWAYC